jgi:hypothetical protein
MSKKIIAADELIFIFCEELRPLLNGRPVPGVAIVPDLEHGWSALVPHKNRRSYPELDDHVAKVQKALRRRYDLKES